MKIYLGTMTFGWEQASSLVTNEVAREMIKVFSMFGHSNVDTAAIYTGGKCEGILANVLPVDYPLSPPLLIGTKAHPSLSSGFDNAGLSDQFANSLSETKQSSFEEYFLHQPDSKQDVLPALKFVNDLIHKGQVKHLGLSNYAAVECERIFALCEEHQLHKPTRYQGLYNPLNRMVEEELLPLLKANGCSFVAYNPLAAGLLTGRHHRGGEVTEGRFKNNPNYLPRFYTEANFEAVEQIEKACAENGNISIIDATYRWMMLHSALTEADGLLLGASSMSQLNMNLECVTDPQPLPADVLAAMNNVYSITKPGAFAYWRGYSKCMPNRLSLHQGADYVAKKKRS